MNTIGHITISSLLEMAVDHHKLLDYYNNVYELITLDNEPGDIERIYSTTYGKVALGSDPTLQDFVSHIPVAPDFEYAGHFRDGLLNYIECGKTECRILPYESMVFHTHPFNSEIADIPSELDLYLFLQHPYAVECTIGRDKCWVFIKTAETLKKVEKMRKWKNKHMVNMICEMVRNNCSDDEITYSAPYLFLEKIFNIIMPNDLEKLLCYDWQNAARKKLGITILVGTLRSR